MDAQVSAAGKARSLEVFFGFQFQKKRKTTYGIILDQDMALDFKMFFSCLVNLWFPTPGTPPLIWAASTKRSQRLVAQRPRCSGRSRCCSLPADSASSIASGPASAWLSMVQRKSLCHWRPAIDHPQDQAKIPRPPRAHLGQISKVQELLSSQGHRLAVFPGVKVPDNSMYSCH